MKVLLLILCLVMMGVTIPPKIDYSNNKYKKVQATTTDSSDCVVIPDGETVAMHRIIINGSKSDAFVRIVFDDGGGSEKIFGSSKGDVDIKFDTSSEDNQITGDGVKEICIIIENNGSTETPVIGGSWGAIKL